MRILWAKVQNSVWRQQKSRVIKLSRIPALLTVKKRLVVVSEYLMQKALINRVSVLRIITRRSRKETRSLSAVRIIKKHNHFLCHELEKENLQIRGKPEVGDKAYYQAYCKRSVIRVVQSTKILLKTENPNHQHLPRIQSQTQKIPRCLQVYRWKGNFSKKNLSSP